MKIILDTKWTGLSATLTEALSTELDFIGSSILRDDVNVKPHMDDDGTIWLEILDAEPSEAPAVPDPTYVVEVNHKYTYLAEPHVVGQINVGDMVDLPGQHEGAHWAGSVSAVMSAEDFEDTEGELPAKFVLGVLSL